MTFARDKNTRLDVGLIRIQAGDVPSEEGFECDMHMPEVDAKMPRPARGWQPQRADRRQVHGDDSPRLFPGP